MPGNTPRNTKDSRDGGEIQFKPINDGLGFHPFSGGLPYTPQPKPGPRSPARPMGTGAVAAGPPAFARQTPVTPVSPAPLVQPRIGQTPIAQPVVRPPLAPSAPARVMPVERYGVEYLAKRFLAFVLDASVNLGLGFLALSAGLWKQGINPELLASSGIVALTILFLVFFDWALLAAQEIAFGTSIGKRVFGLRLEGQASAVLARALVFLPSLALGGIGIIWALFDRNRRGWHDIVSGVQPREIARL